MNLIVSQALAYQHHPYRPQQVSGQTKKDNVNESSKSFKDILSEKMTGSQFGSRK